jgi:hypothetical protein
MSYIKNRGTYGSYPSKVHFSGASSVGLPPSAVASDPVNPNPAKVIMPPHCRARRLSMVTAPCPCCLFHAYQNSSEQNHQNWGCEINMLDTLKPKKIVFSHSDAGGHSAEGSFGSY